VITRAVLGELVAALREQMERCPGCHGAGKIRQEHCQPCFCLVCEEPTKALYLCDRGDPLQFADLADPKILELLTPLYEHVASAAKEFVKRCPGCFGVGRVWSGGQQRPCLVCRRLLDALKNYNDEIVPAVMPTIIDRKRGRQLCDSE
jgi:hypothetical protein